MRLINSVWAKIQYYDKDDITIWWGETFISNNVGSVNFWVFISWVRDYHSQILNTFQINRNKTVLHISCFPLLFLCLSHSLILWIFIVLMLKLKLQYFGHLMQSRLRGKDGDAGKDWRQKEKREAEDEMVR